MYTVSSAKKYLTKYHNVIVMDTFNDTMEKTIFVDSGEAATFDLPPIDSIPSPSVIWQDENGPLGYNQKYVVTQDRKLIILSCSKDDERAYRFVKIYFIIF